MNYCEILVWSEVWNSKRLMIASRTYILLETQNLAKKYFDQKYNITNMWIVWMSQTWSLPAASIWSHSSGVLSMYGSSMHLLEPKISGTRVEGQQLRLLSSGAFTWLLNLWDWSSPETSIQVVSKLKPYGEGSATPIQTPQSFSKSLTVERK